MAELMRMAELMSGGVGEIGCTAGILSAKETSPTS